MTLEQQKMAVRDEMRARLRSVGAEQLAAWSASIVSHVLASAWWSGARGVLLYHPMAGEPDLRALVSAGVGAGKRVCLPRTDWDAGSMESVVVGDLGGLVEVRPGLLEPGAGGGVIPPGQLDLVLVPGLGFGWDGSRLGRGAGFYDRYLGRTPAATAALGVGFACQVRPAVPMGPSDRWLDGLVTEQSVRVFDAEHRARRQRDAQA